MVILIIVFKWHCLSQHLVPIGKYLLNILFLQRFGDEHFYPVGCFCGMIIWVGRKLASIYRNQMAVRMHLFYRVRFTDIDTKKKLFRTIRHAKCTQICVLWVKGQKVQPFSLISQSHLKTDVKSVDLAWTLFLNGIMSAFVCQPP